MIQHICNTFIVHFGKSKIISLTSSIMKNIVVFSARSRFPDQDQDQNRVLIVCLDLLQLVRSFLWGLDNQAKKTELCSCFLELWPFLQCCHMFLCHFYWLTKKIPFKNHDAVVFCLYHSHKISCVGCSHHIILKW